MKFYALLAVLAVVGSSTSFLLGPKDRTAEDFSRDERIVNGTTARPGQFPYMVSFRRAQRFSNGTVIWRPGCGGSIISNRWILSAAHCFSNFNLSNPVNLADFRAVIGAHHLFEDGITHTLTRFINHPRFNWTTLQNDVSLLRTTNPIALNSRARILPIRSSFVGGGVAAVISGWGWSHNMSQPTFPYPTHLQFLPQRTLTNDQCRARHQKQNWRHIAPTSICALAEMWQGIDNGDSGSPLVVNGQQIGIAAWAVHPRARGRPEGYARLSEFTRWIQENSGVAAV